MARTQLLDTGFLVALIDKRDPDHARCSVVARRSSASLVSVEGVLVEAAHLLRKKPNGAGEAINLALAWGTEWVAPNEERLRRASELMRKYADTPMDLVDALLVVTAEERRLTQILTLDRRGFGTYRIGKRKRFDILPAP